MIDLPAIPDTNLASQKTISQILRMLIPVKSPTFPPVIMIIASDLVLIYRNVDKYFA